MVSSSSSIDLSGWKVVLLDEAVEDLKGLDQSVQTRILRGLYRLEIDPLSYGKPLGKELVGCYKLRLGAWRAVYEIDRAEKLVRVIVVEHRERVYDEAKRRLKEEGRF